MQGIWRATDLKLHVKFVAHEINNCPALAEPPAATETFGVRRGSMTMRLAKDDGWGDSLCAIGIALEAKPVIVLLLVLLDVLQGAREKE